MTTTKTACSSRHLSCAVLHNNIGALLHERGEYEDAKKHYQSAKDEASCRSNDSNAAGGLAWFYRKLVAENKRGYVADKSDDSTTVPRRGLLRRNSSAGTLNKPPCSHELTPLGLEYYREPLSVTCTEDVMASSCLNSALMRYENAVGNDQVEELVTELKAHNHGAKSSFLSAAHDSNMGVLLFRLGKSQEALSYFNQAHDTIRSISTPHEEMEFSYLQASILLNRARACVRLNDTKTALRLVSEIEEIDDSVSKKRQQKCSKSSPSVLKMQGCIRWMSVVATRFIMGMIHQRKEELTKALECYKMFVTDARHELGHTHLHVADVLYLKGMILFDQRKLHHAMLAQLACLKIREQHAHADKRDLAKVMYCIGRTLHDREEYRDALQMYQQTLTLQRQIMTTTTCVDVVTTLCNVARVHHVVGDLDACLKVNQEIVDMARRLAQGKKHPFVADRLQVLGNVLVEAGRLGEAMDTYAMAARSGATNNENDYVRNSRYDIDSRWASTLAKAGLQHPGAATA